MPKRARELSALDIKRLSHPSRDQSLKATFAAGGVPGLQMQITPAGAKSWILRCVVGQKRREIGLGSYPEVLLADARDRAREARNIIRQGVDPIENRRSNRAKLIAAQKRGLTFA
ncbi:MAG: Arm DNA-binding domain-containing protein, partial [Hyphomicrobiales bacterium]